MGFRAQYEKDYVIDSDGRMTCPSCGAEGTAQIYDENTPKERIICFRGNCDLHTTKFFNSDPTIVQSEQPKTDEPLGVEISEEQKKENIEIYTKVVDIFHKNLKQDLNKLQALYDRKRTEESISYFKVGLVSNSDDLFEILSKHYSAEALTNCGLFSEQDGQPKCNLWPYSYSYPIWDASGNIVNIKTKSGAKGSYIKKMNTGNFVKALNIPALNNDSVILVEGENDLMRLWELGHKNVIATLGGPSSELIDAIKKSKKIKTIYSCFDNDTAGEEYTLKLSKAFVNTQKKVYKVAYDGKDPDVGTNFQFNTTLAMNKSAIENMKSKVFSEEYQKISEKYTKVVISSKVRFVFNADRFNTWLDFSNLMLFDSEFDKEILRDWADKTPALLGVTNDFEHPGINTNGKLNLFGGFAVEPKNLVNIDKIYHHIKHVLCSGDEEIYKYLLDWIAHILQKPYEFVGTAPVFISLPGAGKGIIMETLLGKIIGSDYFVASGDGKDFTNSFNSILESRLLVNVDEASFSGNHQEAGIFKRIIGNPSIRITRKGLEGYTVENRVRLVFTSQHITAVKVEKNDRRYFFPIVTDEYIYDIFGNSEKGKIHNERVRKYFDELESLIKNGGAETFLYDMLKKDLSSFNRFYAPKNELHRELADLDVSSIEEWFIGCLDNMISQEYSFTNDQDYKTKRMIKISTAFDLYRSFNPQDKYNGVKKFSREISKLLKIKPTPHRDSKGIISKGWILTPEIEGEILFGSKYVEEKEEIDLESLSTHEEQIEEQKLQAKVKDGVSRQILKLVESNKSLRLHEDLRKEIFGG